MTDGLYVYEYAFGVKWRNWERKLEGEATKIQPTTQIEQTADIKPATPGEMIVN